MHAAVRRSAKRSTELLAIPPLPRWVSIRPFHRRSPRSPGDRSPGGVRLRSWAGPF